MKTLKSIFWLVVLGGGVYVGARVVPAYIANYQFLDAMRTVALVNSDQGLYRTSQVLGAPRSEELIKQQLYERAESLGLPVTPDEITVVRAGTEVTISADYAVHVDIPVCPFDLNFHPSSKRM
jgi:ABC-type methionine transport system permease subunit